jgi:glycine/D-amino acid oxidase-like deaminating enzyme
MSSRLPERRAIRVPSDLPGSGWYELLPPPGPARELEGADTADWVIVGAGFAGLAAARRLSQLRPSDKIVVLEAQRVGFGAAGRNSGFMIDLPHDLSTEAYAGANEHDLRTIRLNRAGIAFAREAVEEFGLHDCFEPCGKYHGAADDHGAGALRAFERHLDGLEEAYTALDAGDMKRLTGTDYYIAGTYTPGASLIQPAAFVRGLARGLASKVDIREHSPVLKIESRGEHVVHTPKGRITTPRLILTVNGQIESLDFFSRRLMHVFTYASMTRPLTDAEIRRLGGENAWGLIPADPMGSTVRRLRSNRIVVRNTFTYNPAMATSADQVARIGRRHDASFRARFPMLSDVTMQYRWGGHLCLSLNAVPAFGEIAERMYAACCCNGLGTVQGTLGGKLIAEVATGGSNPVISEFTAGGEPQKLYPEPFMTAGAKAKLWWMQRRAGRDL